MRGPQYSNPNLGVTGEPRQSQAEAERIRVGLLDKKAPASSKEEEDTD